MVGISKEDVLNWYQGLNASHRLETICALLDHSLPFELRFLGSVIENLGRKDFHVLRDAECRTNSLHSSESAPDHAAILKLLSEGPAPTAMTLNPQMMATGGGGFNSLSSSANEASSARPSPTNTIDQKTTDSGKSQSEALKSSENGLPVKTTSLTSEMGGKGTEKCNSVSSVNHAEVNPVEKRDSRQDIWLHDGAKRRKLILYLSLLAATNHDSANLYYILMSEVEDLMESLEWLQGSDQMVQDEIQLLYTIGSHHPAFNFEQRTFLSTVLNRFKECMNSCLKQGGQTFQDSPSPPNQILNHQYLPPQHFEGKFGGYYYYAPQHVQNIQCTQQSISHAVAAGSADGIRTPSYPFVSYPNFPVFMSPPHPNHQHMGQHHQFQGHPFATTVIGSSLPVHGSVLQTHAHPFPQQVPMALCSGSIPTSSPTATGQSSIGNKMQSHSTNTGTHPQSHPSSVSSPTRTSSMASAVTGFQSQANSLDGDSEESSENCTWDSPESSPFESPPQSLTPSRSQSPRTAGVNAKNIVPTPSTAHSSNFVSPVGIVTSNSNALVNNAISNCERVVNPSLPSPGDHGGGTVSSSLQSAALSKPLGKSTMSERKGRPYIAGVSTLSNQSQFPNSATYLPSNISSVISASTTTPSNSLTVSTVPMASSSVLSSSQSSTNQRLGQNQCATLPNSPSSQQCMHPPCSINNASHATNSNSSVSSCGDSTQMPKSILCPNSSANLVTSGICSPSLSTVNTSAYSSNNFSTVLSISSSVNSYPVPLPQHHVVNQTMITSANSYSGESFNSGNPTSMGLVNSVNTAYGNPHKSSSTMHSQSSQGRMHQKPNSVASHNQQSSNQLGAQVHSQQHVMQQLMGQVVGGQLQPSSVSVNNLVGVVTHSISMNTPLLSYGHPPGALNSHGHANYSAYPPAGVSYGAMGVPGSFRPNPQVLNRPAAFMPSHPGSIMNNQMVMKQQQQDPRTHTGGHSSLRQKNPSVTQNHNTPKRRNSNNPTSSGSNLIVSTNVMTNNSSSIVSQSQIGKPEETTDMKDRTNNILVVSANPTKNSSQQQDNRGKIYHHPNSGFSNGPVPIGERVSAVSSSSAHTMTNSSTGNLVPNITASSSVATGSVLSNTQVKGEENLHIEGGMMDYGIAAASTLQAYHSSGHIYGHPGPSFIPMQNGFLPQSYYPNPVTGPLVGMNNVGGPPSTEILMNPGHVQPPYPFTFPFTIPPQHYGNPSIASKAVCANNPAAKDPSKTSLSVMGSVGSFLASDSNKAIVNANDGGHGVPYGRSGPPSNTPIAANIGSLTNPSSLVPPPSNSPMTAQPCRSRGVVLEVGGQVTNAEFPSLASLENALMPPLEDPVEINCRPRKTSCYNCGSNTHLGPECKEASMEEMTRKQYRLNYGGPSSSESKEGE